ncbi:MAG: hypothetical protein QM811_17800 [Pirellulales bacterium]
MESVVQARFHSVDLGIRKMTDQPSDWPGLSLDDEDLEQKLLERERSAEGWISWSELRATFMDSE